MLTHDELKTKALRNPYVQAEYNALEAEFTWFAALLQARNRAGLTQTEVAERMGTTPSAVARLEAGGGSQKHSPSIATLHKYAEAVGCTIEIRLVPCTPPTPRAGSGAHRKPRVRSGSGRGAQTKETPSRSPAEHPGPNKGVQATGNSVRSAPAIARA